MEEVLVFTLLVVLGAVNGHVFVKDRKGLYNFPPSEEFFANCTKIQLRYNYISYIPENALCHVKDLWSLNLERNRLTEIGNLSCIGQSLTHIYFHSNLISTISAEAFFNLTKLRLLYLYSNRLTQMPDITLLSGTLTHLRVDNNVNIKGNISNGYFDNFPLQMLGLGNLGFKTFPNLTALKPTLRYFYFNHNKCSFKSLSELNKYHQLQVLHLYDVGITIIPSLRLDKVHQLHLGGNNFESVTQEQYGNLVLPNLKQLYISKTKIKGIEKVIHSEKITDLSISYDPISIISHSDMNKFDLLKLIHSDYMVDLKSFKCPSHRKMYLVYLRRNKLTSLLQICHCTQRMFLSDNYITTLSPISASLMKYNRELVLYRNNLYHISDYIDLEYASSTKLNLIGNKNLDLCRCEHVWLKIAKERGVNIQIDDIVCENAENWHNMSVSTLLQTCKDSFLADESQSGWSDKRKQASSCELPVHYEFTNVHQQHCATLCLQQKGCAAYTFTSVSERRGDCQLLIPKQASVTITPKSLDSNCFLVARE